MILPGRRGVRSAGVLVLSAAVAFRCFRAIDVGAPTPRRTLRFGGPAGFAALAP